MGISEKIKYQKSNIKLIFTLFFIFIICTSLFAQKVKIGVALPLFEGSEDNSKKQLGNEILNGLTFALNDFSKSSKTKVSLEVMDTQRDPKLASEIITGFGEDSTISCVIGPVFSSEMLECVELGEKFGIPVISPTATGDNLATDHNFLYQLNPTYEVRGKLMADYLVKQLGMKNFAVIYEENYGANFFNHFSEQVKKLGGKVISGNPYPKDITNIGEIIGTIYKVIKENDLFIKPSNLNLVQRQKLENAGVRYSLIDSLINSKLDVSIYFLLGKNAKKIFDTLNVKPYKLKPEVNKFVQGYIDAIYIPVSNPAEISVIVPQLFSDGLSFFIAGTGDWNNEQILEENKVYIKNLTFESEYFPDSTGGSYIELVNKLKKSKYKLSKNFLFGYDAMNLILKQIDDGAKTRLEINDALKNVLGFEAFKSKISLDYYRVNSELNILRYNEGIKHVENYKLNK